MARLSQCNLYGASKKTRSCVPRRIYEIHQWTFEISACATAGAVDSLQGASSFVMPMSVSTPLVVVIIGLPLAMKHRCNRPTRTSIVAVFRTCQVRCKDLDSSKQQLSRPTWLNPFGSTSSLQSLMTDQEILVAP